MFDLKNNIKLVESLNAIVKDADTNSTGIDTQGSNSAMVMVNVGAPGGTVGGTGIWQTIDADGDCNAVYGLGYVGPKRYIRCVLDFSGTHGTGTVFGVTGALGNLESAPTDAQANL